MKTRVGVFFGGKSVEHEVSVITAMQAIAALNAEKYDIVPVYTTKDNRFFTGSFASSIDQYRDIDGLLEKSNRIDLVPDDKGGVRLIPHKRAFLGAKVLGHIDVALLCYHGTAGEDGSVQGMMELLNLPYTGCSVQASCAGMDKWVMSRLFTAAGLNCVKSAAILRRDFYADIDGALKKIQAEIGLPAIIKPSNLGSSVGISKASDANGLLPAIEEGFLYSDKVIIEQAIAPLREINCAVLGDCDSAIASPLEEPVLDGDLLSFADKYQRGQKGGAKDGGKTGGTKEGGGMSSLSRTIPADIPKELEERIKEMALLAFKAIGASGVARIDFLLNADTMEAYINEINTIPGSLSFYLFDHMGMSFGQLLDRLIFLAFKKHKDKEKLTFSFETNLLQHALLGGAKGSKIK